MHAKLLQSCLTPCYPMDHKPARLLCPWDSPGKNTGVGSHAIPEGNLPELGIEPVSLMSPALAGRFFTTSITWEAKIGLKILTWLVFPQDGETNGNPFFFLLSFGNNFIYLAALRLS